MFNKFRKNTNDVTDTDIEWIDPEIEEKRDIFKNILLGYSAIMSTVFLIFLATFGFDKPEISAETETTAYIEETTTTDIGSCETLEQITVGQVEETTTPEIETTIEATTEAISLYSEEDIELLALVMLAEAEGEDEYGRRLVVSTILNRVDSEKYPNTIREVVYQKGQFSSMFNGRADRVVVTDEAREQVRKELESRTNYDVLYFRMYRYHSWGTPLFVHGCHYFSGE